MAVNSDLDEVAPGLAFITAFGNVTGVVADGSLVLVDTGSQFLARANFDKMRAWTDLPLAAALYRTGTSITSSASAPTRTRRPPPVGAAAVVAHELVSARFDRYRLTAGYNAVINARQFKIPPACSGPPSTATPTRPTSSGTMSRWAASASSCTMAGARPMTTRGSGCPTGALCTGDLFIWASPNCGNPQKVQRYPRDWAIALREMVALEPELLLPGHGWPIAGADRVRQALTETADLLDSLVDQTLELMNAGRPPRRHRPHGASPSDLLDRPYLRPVYDEPEFVVRNRVAPLRRLVRRQPGPPEARPRGPSWPRAGGPRGGAAAGRPGGASWRPPGSCAWPATWPSWPRRRRPTTRASTGYEPRSSAPDRRRSCRRCRRACSPGPPTSPRPASPRWATERGSADRVANAELDVCHEPRTAGHGRPRHQGRAGASARRRRGSRARRNRRRGVHGARTVWMRWPRRSVVYRSRPMSPIATKPSPPWSARRENWADSTSSSTTPG